MWERQVLAAATDHSDTAIRQAMLQSLKGQALMVTTTLPPNTHWKELLQALRIKYQSKAPYDVHSVPHNSNSLISNYRLF